MLQRQRQVGAAAVVVQVGGVQPQVGALVGTGLGLAVAFQGQRDVATRQGEGEAAQAGGAQQVVVVTHTQRHIGAGMPAMAQRPRGGQVLHAGHALLRHLQLLALALWQLWAGAGLCQQLHGAGRVSRAGQRNGIGKGGAQVLRSQQQGAFQVFGGFGVFALCVEPFAQVGEPVGLVLAQADVGQQLFQAVVPGLWSAQLYQPGLCRAGWWGGRQAGCRALSVYIYRGANHPKHQPTAERGHCAAGGKPGGAVGHDGWGCLPGEVSGGVGGLNTSMGTAYTW